MNIESYTMFTGRPKKGVWYKVFPERCASSDGSPWYGFYKKGKEDKLLIFFFGGGVSVDTFTAAQDVYSKHPQDDLKFISVVEGQKSILSEIDENPFKDWSKAVVCYSTGDFHCGAGEFPYKNADGEDKQLYHEGFTNANGFFEQVSMFDDPEYVCISGYSAGAFGALILGKYIKETYYKNADSFSVLADSACAVTPMWHSYAENTWHTPKFLVDKIHSDNIAFDFAEDLKSFYKDKCNILFIATARDIVLTSYQSYLKFGKMGNDVEAGAYYENVLAQMKEKLLGIGASVLIPSENEIYVPDTGYTYHCIINKDFLYELETKDPGDTEKTIKPIDWIVKKIGTDKFD